MLPAARRERYLRDPLPIRLGGLAADLARVASCAANPKNWDAVVSLLEEGKYCAEWAAPDAPPDIQAELADVQVQMAYWQLRWVARTPEPRMREEAQRRSEHLLALSGLA